MDRLKSPPTVNTRNVLFIFSGAFNDMNQYLSRIHGGEEGGEEKGVNGSYLHLATTGDYVKCGFSQEFIGRIPTRVNLTPLTKKDLMDILSLTTSERSVLRREQDSFASFGMGLELTECAVEAIAERCVADDTGARGLGGVLEEVTRDFKFELGGRGYNSEVRIDAEAVRDNSRMLRECLGKMEEMERGR